MPQTFTDWLILIAILIGGAFSWLVILALVLEFIAAAGKAWRGK